MLTVIIMTSISALGKVSQLNILEFDNRPIRLMDITFYFEGSGF